jgi:hypothetical protein
MALVTGTPLGTITAQSDLYIDSAPTFYYQDNLAQAHPYAFNPDGDGFYWGLTGSAANPVFQMGCYEGFQLAGNIEMTSIRCDTVGDKSAIQKLSYLDVTFTLKTLFPLTTLRHILRWGAVTTSGSVEKLGIGQPNNQRYFYAYFPVVYDGDTGDWLNFTLHRCQFVDSWQLAFTYGQPATVGLTLRGFAEENKPAAQLFATVIRADPSDIP